MENYEYHRSISAIHNRVRILNVTKHFNVNRTTESYQQELDDDNRNIDVLGKYMGVETKIAHKCRKCGYEWDAQPSNILYGRGCPKCNKGNVNRTTESYQKELDDANRNIGVLGIFLNTTTKILHKCRKCSYEWDSTPGNILGGQGCPKCAKPGVDRTTKSYQKELDTANRNIEVLGKYMGVETKIAHKCRKCEYEWDAIPSSILSGTGCPKCGKSLKKDTTSYQKELDDANRNIGVVGIYVNNSTKIAHKCRKCEYEWDAAPSWVLQGCGCPKCNKGNVDRTTKSYQEELDNANRNIDVIGMYVNASTKIAHKCRKCEYEWDARPIQILRGSGCPKCANMSRGANRCKKIKCVETSRVFSSMVEVAQYYRINRHSLGFALKQNAKCAGYHWEYVEEGDKTNEKS